MRVLRLLPAVIVGVGLIACDDVAEPIPDELQPNFMMGAPVVVTVVGSGHYAWNHPSGWTAWRTLSFNARKNADGLVDGWVQTRNHGGAGSWMKGSVICLSTDAEEAWLGVEITKASREDLLGPRGFKVLDGGEGQGAAPDLASNLGAVPSAEEFCGERPGRLMREAEAGNIWVLYEPPRSQYKQ